MPRYPVTIWGRRGEAAKCCPRSEAIVCDSYDVLRAALRRIERQTRRDVAELSSIGTVFGDDGRVREYHFRAKLKERQSGKSAGRLRFAVPAVFDSAQVVSVSVERARLAGWVDDTRVRRVRKREPKKHRPDKEVSPLSSVMIEKKEATPRTPTRPQPKRRVGRRPKLNPEQRKEAVAMVRSGKRGRGGPAVQRPQVDHLSHSGERAVTTADR